MPEAFTESESGDGGDGQPARRPRFRDEHVTMSHGAGGKASRRLVEGLIVPALANPALAVLGDAGVLELDGRRLAISTDAFVVRPLRFPGGSIGELAVNGTVNDLAVSGAQPLALAVAFVLEEGLGAQVLEAEVAAVAAASERAGVPVVTGDTKVVERGKADGMYVVTTGIGQVLEDADVDPTSVRPGDAVIVSGPVGDHGIAIMLARGELAISADVASDTAPLWDAARTLVETCGSDLHTMRDATRGGVATVLNEIAAAAGVGVVLDESTIPVRDPVRGASELLGIDPLYVANEGKLVAFVDGDRADDALTALRRVPGCEDAAVIGQVAGEPSGRVLARTTFGGHRVIDTLVGDPLPRIC